MILPCTGKSENSACIIGAPVLLYKCSNGVQINCISFVHNLNNLFSRKAVQSMRKLSMKNEGIMIRRCWDYGDVMTMCIKHEFYTQGDCKAYNTMLDYVRDNCNPDYDDIYTVALDILEHSNTTGYCEEEFLYNIMFCLEKECVYTCFDTMSVE